LARYVEEKSIDTQVGNTVRTRIEELSRLIDEEPKGRDWQKRSKVGPQKKWWRDVEERSR